MCGILGGSNMNWDYEAGINCMQHRGPDGIKVVRFDEFILAFARLAIIDLSEVAMQPMATEDRKYCIVFNGEIYDYANIREKLEKLGYVFKSKSDTEVLLYAYVEWKERFVEHFDGMFAIAIYDIENQKISLFRDRAGIKPLYYYYDGKNFGFSSELKGIEHMCSTVSLKIDETAIYDYYTYLYIPEPKTMYKHVFKVCPAQQIVFNLKTSRIEKKRKYWKLKVNELEGSKACGQRLNDLSTELKLIMKDVVSKQMVADVTVGTFLSGGVDSSIISSIGHEINPGVESFCIGFKEKRYDESPYARMLADFRKLNCEVQIMGKEYMKEIEYTLPNLYDEPYADTSAFPTYMVSKLAKKNATVVLTGDGGDEVFGGYSRCTYADKYLNRKILNNRAISQITLQLQENFRWLEMKELNNYLLEDTAKLADLYLYPKKPDRKALRKRYNIDRDYDDYWHYRKYYIKDLPPMTRMRYLDFMTYLPGDILTKVDRASMAVSLETRVPFLDKKVVEFAFGLTQEECCPGKMLKGLLKKTYEDTVPKQLLYRKKMGFSIPQRFYNNSKSVQEQIINKYWKL